MKNKSKKIISAITAMTMCSAFVFDYPKFLVESITCNVHAKEYDMKGYAEIEDNNWYSTDDESFNTSSISVIDSDGNKIEDAVIDFGGATPANTYNGKTFDYTVPFTVIVNGENCGTGEINVKIGQSGDANSDHKVDMRDAAYIARLISQGRLNEIPKYSDLNHDGHIDVLDSTGIAQKVSTGLVEKIGCEPIERDSNSYASVSIGSMEAVAGETVSVPVNIKCNNNFESGAFIIEWDNTELIGSEASYVNGTINSNAGNNFCTIVIYAEKAISDGTISFIDFKVPEDAKPGSEYKINITYIETFSEYDGEDLADTVSVHGGTITVSQPAITGDANGDGKLDVRDAAYIARMLANGQGDEIPLTADFNGDGQVNVRDAAAIARYLSKKK